MIALVDCDNFYCSVEQAFAPSLQGKPVGICTSAGGCIIARSPELKALGVEMGTPRHLLPPHIKRQTVMLMANLELYGDMSRRVTDVLKMFTPDLTCYSIDESFLSFDGFPTETLLDRGIELRYTVRKWTGIGVSVGLAPTKVLAKIATRVAKKQAWREGVCMLRAEAVETQRLLSTLACADIWGIARRTAEKLERLGITTALGLRDADPKVIRRHLGVVVERIVWELRGHRAITLEDMNQPRHQIMLSRTFNRTTSNKRDIAQSVRGYVVRAGEKLRRQESVASAVIVFIQTNPRHVQSPQHSNRVLISFNQPTDDTLTINKAAQEGLRRIYRGGYAYQKAGILLMHLEPKQHRQMTLDETSAPLEDAKRENLMSVLDKLNGTMGKGTVTLGRDKSHHPTADSLHKRTNRFTTRWNELLVVKA